MQITKEMQEDPDFNEAVMATKGINDFAVSDYLKSYLIRVRDTIRAMQEGRDLIDKRILRMKAKEEKIRGWLNGGL